MGGRVIQVPGVLTSKCRDTWHVELSVTTVSVYVRPGIENERVRKVELDSTSAPDGEYMLEYFFFSDRTEYVRVENGALLHHRRRAGPERPPRTARELHTGRSARP
jgi:hypothetical protein